MVPPKISSESGSSLASVVTGSVLFLTVQIFLLMNAPGPLRSGENAGWFLNSGRNLALVGLTLACGAAVLALRRPSGVGRPVMVWAGATVAMTATLFVIGPGNIFPIVIIIGAVVVAVAVSCGTVVGFLVRSAVRWAAK